MVWFTYGGGVYFLSIYICWLSPWRQIDDVWMDGYDDHTMWSLCPVFHSSYDLACVANVIRMWMTMLGLGLGDAIYEW